MPIIKKALSSGISTFERNSIPEKDIRELVRQARKGNAAAWAKLRDMHYDFIETMLNTWQPHFLRQVPWRGPTDKSQFGIVDEIFDKAKKSLFSFKFKSRFSTWLCAICRNTCVNYYRKQVFGVKREQRYEEFSVELCRKLSANLKPVFRMWIKGKKYQDIARALLGGRCSYKYWCVVNLFVTCG